MRLPMTRTRFLSLALSFVAAIVTAAPQAFAASPVPVSTSTSARAATESIVFAGGCFWGVEAVFRHVKGVTSAVSGYSGGDKATAHYEIVSSGRTDHAESVQVEYDPAVVTLDTLLNVFFTVAHNPTELNRQGPDVGTQYRSAIFYSTPVQQETIAAFIAKLQASKVYGRPIVTAVEPLKGFYAAEAYHQDYMKKHPNQPYIVFNDKPKVANLKTRFPELYVEG